MEKIFCLYAEVQIIKKEKWLTDFREKYSEPYGFHITLKQPCNMKEIDIPRVKKRLEQFFKEPKNKGSFEVIFDYLFNPEYKGCVMIGLKSGKNKIYALQKDLVNLFQDYSDYVEPGTEQYEKNFVPHLTIGDGEKLVKENHENAIKDLPGRIEIRGIIKEIVLVIAKEARPEQSLNPDNLTKFKL